MRGQRVRRPGGLSGVRGGAGHPFHYDGETLSGHKGTCRGTSRRGVRRNNEGRGRVGVHRAGQQVEELDKVPPVHIHQAATGRKRTDGDGVRQARQPDLHQYRQLPRSGRKTEGRRGRPLLRGRYDRRKVPPKGRGRAGAQEHKGTGHQGTASLQADGDEQGVLLYAGHLAFPFRDLQTGRNGQGDPGHIVSGDLQEEADRFRRQDNLARKEHNIEGHRGRRRGDRHRGTMEALPVAAPDRGRLKIRADRR